ncbi:hypothetical protein FOL47_003858, partial [Perkinsus chesapeaki]
KERKGETLRAVSAGQQYGEFPPGERGGDDDTDEVQRVIDEMEKERAKEKQRPGESKTKLASERNEERARFAQKSIRWVGPTTCWDFLTEPKEKTGLIKLLPLISSINGEIEDPRDHGDEYGRPDLCLEQPGHDYNLLSADPSKEGDFGSVKEQTSCFYLPASCRLFRVFGKAPLEKSPPPLEFIAELVLPTRSRRLQMLQVRSVADSGAGQNYLVLNTADSSSFELKRVSVLVTLANGSRADILGKVEAELRLRSIDGSSLLAANTETLIVLRSSDAGARPLLLL